MSTTLERSRKGEKQRTYTATEVEAGLQLAATLGNKTLAAAKLGIDRRTLSYWCRKSHQARYLQIREEIAPKIHAQIAAETEDLALEMTEVAAMALARTRETIPELAAKDAAAATKNLTFALNNAVDKSLLIRGKPTSIVEKRDVDVLFRKLEQAGIVEGTAVEIDQDETDTAQS